MKAPILIAGIGSGSLGLEIYKCLRNSSEFEMHGADIASTAWGHNEGGFASTHTLSATSNEVYLSQLLDLATELEAKVVFPGAEAVHRLLATYKGQFEDAGIRLAINSPDVINLCNNKFASLARLAEAGFCVPKQSLAESPKAAERFDCFPCIVKPVIDSGGSNMVFIADNATEADMFSQYMRSRGVQPMLQEYIDSTDEYTVGVASLPGRGVVGAVALKRALSAKLSSAFSYDGQVISSGWSQGEINEFPEISAACVDIAKSLGSEWALNIQGRVNADGQFLPFEINPRHSGTSYLRALAGVNEPEIMLKALLHGTAPESYSIKPGRYMRAFTEQVSPLT